MKKLFLFLVLVLFLIRLPQAEPVGRNFISEAHWIFQVFACGKEREKKPVSSVDAEYCRFFTRRASEYRKNYIEKVRPFLAKLRPENLPSRVVYPFGGNDLASALATYPDMKEITTISLENAGDPRRIIGAPRKEMKRTLKDFQKFISHILRFHDHSNADVRLFEQGLVPGQVTLSLVAASLYGYKPVSLRFFTIEKEGSIQYLSSDDITRMENKRARSLHRKWKRPPFSKAFRNMELILEKSAAAKGARRIVHRHIAWNLDNRHFKGSPLERHLRKKKKISVIVKGGSYLLWFNSFSVLRDYLLENMSFMYSDATGILPRHARRAGFKQKTFGRFYGAFLDNDGGSDAMEMRGLFRSQPYRPLSFRYGHADNRGSYHLIITRPGQ